MEWCFFSVFSNVDCSALESSLQSVGWLFDRAHRLNPIHIKNVTAYVSSQLDEICRNRRTLAG